MRSFLGAVLALAAINAAAQSTNFNQIQHCQGRSKTLPVGRSKNRPVEKQEVEGLAGSMASGA